MWDIGIIFWMVIIGIAAGLEVYALMTSEQYFPTLSKTTWRLLGLDDRSFDQHEIKVRWTLTIVLIIIYAWLVFHLAWGPCEFGVDWLFRSCR